MKNDHISNNTKKVLLKENFFRQDFVKRIYPLHDALIIELPPADKSIVGDIGL